MSVHLVGGGRNATVYADFVAEAVDRATSVGREGPARIAVVLVHDGGGAEFFDWFAGALTGSSAADVECVPVLLAEGDTLDPTALADTDGLLVGGGLTPAYRSGLAPAFGEIRRLVASGVPYCGMSAGAAIAAERAIVGGWRIGGVVVCPEETAEDLDEVTVEQGIGLVDVSIDVHAAQWGTLTRLIASTEAGIVPGGLGIDEDTVVIVGAGALRVVGAGSAWSVVPTETGVSVSSAAAGG
ncbi:type 1 glutamine amidotransferase family protein [Planctomonas psychrotolerans]|uniref:peptidase S51 n=1 Tax=Planctomonas psychrotolerans TaxID=2528712 RepID=UPI001238FD65|nr:peptidase S51 [Planctomonas psychrotolerans]